VLSLVVVVEDVLDTVRSLLISVRLSHILEVLSLMYQVELRKML
jgi:hypothetical protein